MAQERCEGTGRQLKEVITASEPPSWLWLGSVGGFCLETAVSKGSLASGTVPDPTNSSPAPVLEVLGAVLPDPTGSGSLGCFPEVPEEQQVLPKVLCTSRREEFQICVDKISLWYLLLSLFSFLSTVCLLVLLYRPLSVFYLLAEATDPQFRDHQERLDLVWPFSYSSCSAVTLDEIGVWSLPEMRW